MRLLHLNSVWLMEPKAAKSYLRVYFDILSRRNGADIPHAAIESRGNVEQVRMTPSAGGVAQINVRGPIVPHSDLMSEVSGMATVEGVRAQLREADNDESIGIILMSFDTPGGVSTGVGDLAYYVREVNQRKPIIAFVEGLCCSAGNYIAAGAGYRFVSDIGIMGSIGSMMAWIDDSKQMEMIGLEEIEFIASQSPNKNPDPHTSAGKAQYQQLVDDNCAIFVRDMAKLYGVSEDVVMSDFGQGKVFTGKRAVRAGLADKVASYDEVLGLLSRGKIPQRKQPSPAGANSGGNKMSLRDRLAALLEGDVRDDTEREAPAATAAVTVPATATPVPVVAAPPLTIAGMTEAEVLAMKARDEASKTLLAQHQQDAANAFAASISSRYLENGAGETASDRATAMKLGAALHLKAQRGEPITAAELTEFANVPVMGQTVRTAALIPADLEGAKPGQVEASQDPEAEGQKVTKAFVAKANAARGHNPKE